MPSRFKADAIATAVVGPVAAIFAGDGDVNLPWRVVAGFVVVTVGFRSLRSSDSLENENATLRRRLVDEVERPLREELRASLGLDPPVTQAAWPWAVSLSVGSRDDVFDLRDTAFPREVAAGTTARERFSVVKLTKVSEDQRLLRGASAQALEVRALIVRVGNTEYSWLAKICCSKALSDEDAIAIAQHLEAALNSAGVARRLSELHDHLAADGSK